MNFLFLCTRRFLRPTTAARRVANHVRLLSVSGARSGPSANEIRRQFIDYFTNKHNHRLIRSSSLVPFSDGTIAFVNAGMNQFKNVFLGTADRPCARAVNSQKCVRVGGKHNDLSVVGTDSYHHTFFEMLGNWSFGDYFKREACEMACDLLRTVYHIDMERVYVTYFGGDARLNLPADEECRDIWLSLGIPRERVLPFGARDNFWEMGNSGPCGPCTEIHLDLSDQYRDTASRRQYVNAGLPDLTEIWNIVFIQYNRSLDGDGGAIRNLPQRHVDTGMGLERLVAHLQGKLSNYDTDLFTPILQRIQQVTRKPAYSGCFNRTDSQYDLDTAYRVLADHSRMITACLADGMFPSQNHKLRRVIRKSLALASGTFERPKLLEETIPVVVETLGEVYPEMGNNLSTVLQIIEHEQHSYERLCSKRSAETAALLQRYPQLEESEVLDHAGLPGAIRELVETNVSRLDGAKIHKMYDTYGLDEELLVKLGEMLKFSLDFRDYERYAGELKHGFKHELASRLEERLSAFQQLRDSIEGAQLQATRSERKYNYAYNAQRRIYEVAPCSTRITLLLDDPARNLWHVVTEKSNFYCESGGQQSDTGRLLLPDGNISIEVTSVNDHYGFIVHSIPKQPNVRLSVGDSVELHVDAPRRTSLTLHHTATHLLNAIVRKIVPHPMCQRSSSVTEKGLRLELAISGDKLTLEQIAAIETEIRSVIDRNEPVSVQVCNASELDLTAVTIVPGETYPERGLRVISIGGGRTSQELCCGTHAAGTGELQDFAITGVTQSKNGCFTFHAVAGPAAKQVHLLGTQIQNDVAQLQQDAEQNEGQEDITIIETRLQRLKSVLLTGTDNNMHLPYCVRQRCLEVIGALYQKLKDRSRESLRELVDIEMRNLMEQRPADRDEHRFIVHFLECSIILDEVQLSKATRYCPDRPILVVSITDNQVKARATVPPAFVSERFNAQRWLALVAQEFKAQSPTAPKGQNPTEVCNMKARKVTKAHFETMLENALRVAERFAEENVPQMGRGPAQLKE
ncbi:alanine--tRNA ligase, mitochondrial-like [Anopheles albimanus]|uniref:Alanine--tRNA ligase n=1 Tax=Anopheles albimanus TaxID=7167 RepID=A0A182FGC2_ANOAL|nr:alanine--tRNA ligase, mitochondrial-like [Anopheles albimanus]